MTGRIWVDVAPGMAAPAGALALDAANMNAMEADITNALGVPDAALASRINDTTPSSARAALNGIFAAKANLCVNLKDYNPTGGGADDTAAFNAAITALRNKMTASGSSALGRGWIYVPNDFYRLTNLSIPQGVNLFCDGTVLGPNTSSTGPMLTFNSARSGITGAYLAGGAVVGCSAITTSSGAFHVNLERLAIDNWDGRAIYDTGGQGTQIVDVFAQNCLLGANSLAAYTGVLELNATDAWVDRCEFTASRNPGRGMSTPKFACAIAVTGANNMIHKTLAETSDHGVYIGSGASQSQFVGVRAELNYGHGYVIQGGSGEMVACHALRNSQAGSNLYDGWNNNGFAAQFITRGLYSESGGSQPTQNHAVADSNTSGSVYTSWDVKSVGDTQPAFTANSGQTSVRGEINNPPASFTGSTLVTNGKQNFIAANVSATNLTAIQRVVNGQRILIKGDGQTTVVVGANLATISGSNLLLAAGTWYEFVGVAGVVTQVR